MEKQSGLTMQEVKERVAMGLVNRTEKDRKDKRRDCKSTSSYLFQFPESFSGDPGAFYRTV